VKTTVWAPEGVLASLELLILRCPAVAVLTVQPVASPKLVGWVMPEPVTVKPLGVLQVPTARSQTSASNDLTIVPVVGTVKLKVLVADAEGTPLDRVSDRVVIWSALATRVKTKPKTGTIKTKAQQFKTSR
jgi:hypothetical protein